MSSHQDSKQVPDTRLPVDAANKDQQGRAAELDPADFDTRTAAARKSPHLDQPVAGVPVEGSGPDPGAEGLQSIGSEAQGVAGEAEDAWSAPTKDVRMEDVLDPVGDAHQDVVEAFPEGTGDALIRGAIWGPVGGALIEAADATGVLDDTQDRVNEQIEDFLYDEDTVDVGYKVLEAQAAVSKAPWEGAVAVGELAEDAGKHVEEMGQDAGDVLKELDPSHTPPIEAVSDAYWDASFAVDDEGRRAIDKLDEGAISDELGRAADTVGDAAEDAGNAIEDAADDAGDAADDAGDAIGDAAEDTGDAIGDAVGDGNPFD